MASRKKRRADGTLRPAVARGRARRSRIRALDRWLAYDQLPERAEWVAQFEPGERERFMRHSRFWMGRYLAATATELGLAEGVASKVLESVANGKGWMKLRKSDGTVVGIAPPRHRPKKRQPEDLIGDLFVQTIPDA